MKNISRLLILTAALFISACSSSSGTATGSGSGNGTPTDTTTDFNLFPPDFFSSYDVSADLSGTFSDGVNPDVDVTGVLTEKIQAQSVFSGQAAIPFLMTTSFTSSIAYGTAVITNYYSIDADNRRFLGSEDDVVSTAATTPAVLPKTGRIGDSGDVGVYIDDDGFESTITWRLEDGFDGKAKLIILNKTNNAAGAPDYTTTTTYLIQPDGTRLSVELVTFNETVKMTITLGGDYN
ncbi:MAG TPA: hypothetical protein ENI98_00355 [Gammaproteobacteria bacterium]|nr:hypothetical protein [Gammaproteobacteria bacterium]